VAHVGSAPHWVTEDETLVSATSSVVEVANCVPLNTRLARFELGGSCGGEGSREGEESGGDAGVHVA
jgi:hypothetical protein